MEEEAAWKWKGMWEGRMIREEEDRQQQQISLVPPSSVPFSLDPPRSSSSPRVSPGFTNPSLPFGSQTYYGKKFDTEPWRCRRSDGKKWRCSKEAYPGSRYCEHHKKRGRNRSRKLVESETPSPLSPSCSSSLTVTAPSGFPNPGEPRTFCRNNPLSSLISNHSSPHMFLAGAASSQPLAGFAAAYDDKYFVGAKGEAGEFDFFSDNSGSIRSFIGIDSTDPAPTPPYLFPPLQIRDPHIPRGGAAADPSAIFEPMHELGQVTVASMSKDHCRHPIIVGNDDFCMPGSAREIRELPRFFSGWSSAKD